MDFKETLEYMMSRLPMYQKVGGSAFKKGLGNIKALCDALGNPQEQYDTIHVAGTNGKGSSTHFIASVFQMSGYKTGLYTSPHLKSFTERVKVNGLEIPESEVIDFIKINQNLIEEIQPSFFEMTVAMAFQFFAKQKVDIAMIETGLGGRLDSTNILKRPLACLITNISYDHTDMLGETLAEIAGEKAGIIKSNVPVIISERQEETAHVFTEKARQQGAPLFFAEDTITIKEVNEELHVLKGEETWIENLRLGLLGKHQIKNALGVLKVIDLINSDTLKYVISEENLQLGIENVVQNTGLKGRWQQLNETPLTFCDVLHNEAGIEILLHQLSKYSFENLFIVWGMVADKKHGKILSMLPKSAYYIFCKPNVPRGLSAQELSEKAKEYGLRGEVLEDVNEAYQKALTLASENDFIFIGGSTFVVAEVPI